MTQRNYKPGREGWGSLRLLPSGNWQASYVVAGTRYTAPHTFKKKTDARSWLARQRTAVEEGTWKAERDDLLKPVLFGEFAEEWVSQRRTASGDLLKPKTAAEYQRQIRVGLSPLSVLPIKQVTAQRVAAWQAKRAAVAPTAAGAESRLLRAILNTAMEYGHITKNPVPAKFTKTSARRKHRPPTLEELDELLAAISTRFRLGIILAAYGGLRLSEWRALRRQDLVLDRGRYTINICRQAQHISGRGWIVGPPKSERGVRRISLPRQTTPEIERHLHDFVAEAPDALIFPPAGSSTYFQDSEFNKSWNSARDVAGVRGVVRQHDLRSWYASSLHEAGASPLQVRDAMGHADLRTTERHYLRVLSDGAGARADAMELPPGLTAHGSSR